MNPTDKIDKLIKDLNTTASPDLDRRIDSLINQHQAPRSRPLSTWSILMRNKMIPFAVAAVILIAVLIGIQQLGGTLDGASVAWGQVVEQINSHTRYKCRERVVRENGPPVPTMDVYHLNLSQRRQEVENGDIHIIDMRAADAITVELYPAQKKATVTRLLGFGPRQDPDIIEMVKRFEQESTESLGTRKINGKTLQGFHFMPNEYNDFTVWVDPKTKLPVEIELKHPHHKQTIFLDEFEFDFDLPPSAFSTEVPEGYEVKTLINDHRPVEPREVTADEIQSELTHTFYTCKPSSGITGQTRIRMIDPLGGHIIVYVTGVQVENGHLLLFIQGGYYDMDFMTWIPSQSMALKTPGGVKLYTHPNGTDYAQYFLEAFAKAAPDFTGPLRIGDDRFTRMIVMPDDTVLGFCSNRELSDEKLGELVEALSPVATQ